jgi:hypothetical protein
VHGRITVALFHLVHEDKCKGIMHGRKKKFKLANKKINMTKAFIMCHADQKFHGEHTQNKVTRDEVNNKK